MAKEKSKSQSRREKVMANENLNREMSATEKKDLHKLVDDIVGLKKEGVVIAVTSQKYTQGGRRGVRQQGIIFAEGMDKAKVIALVAQGMGATTLDLLLAMAEAKKGDAKPHKHDEDGNCIN